jgi:CRP/FNR family transcriptional regulator, cyclic AMP receptor protein
VTRTTAGVASLADIDLFRGLTAQELTRLDDLLAEGAFPARVDIMLEDQPGEVAYVILAGSVKIHLEQPDGTEVILAVLAEGEVVGEMSLVDSLGRSATVGTLEESRLAWMDRESFWECLRTMPTLSYNLHGLLARRLRLANTHIEALASLDVGGRVARHLLGLAAEYGQPAPGGTRLSIPLTQSDLAALVGASRVRVNQVLGQFRRRRYISVDRDHRVTVVDPEALRKRCR